jgi:regulator of protease activity HflC (stomatin/prohibitin superfamily)
LREILDDATDKWGTRVVRVEIQRIDPPPDVIAAMHHQMKAERTRRAVVTEAQGAREASITRAEGEKQSAILTAEGFKQGQILQAQGEAEATRAVADAERFRQLTVAEGEAAAIRSVYGAIHDGRPTADVLAVKYLEALQVIADGQATKIFLPIEASALLGALGGLGQALDWNGTGAPVGPATGDGLAGDGQEAPAG